MKIESNRELEFIWSREYSFLYSERAVLGMLNWASEDDNEGVSTVVYGQGKSGWFSIYISSGVLDRLEQKYQDEINNQPTLIKQRIDQTHNIGKSFVSFTQSLTPNIDLSDHDIVKLYTEFAEIYARYCTELHRSFHLVLTVEKMFGEFIDENFNNTDKMNAIESLSIPTHKAALSKIADYFGKNVNVGDRVELLKTEYPWIKTSDPFSDSMSEMQMTDYAKSFNPHSSSSDNTRCPVDEKYQNFIQIYQDLLYLKDARDEYRRQAFYYAKPFLTQVAKRMNIELSDLGYLTADEVKKYFVSKISVLKLIENRKSGYIIRYEQDKREIISGNEVNYLDSDKEVSRTSDIKGKVCSSGVVRGIVKVVTSVKDLDEVQNGDVMVAITTNPEYISAMQKAVAFVTDEGGITCHAAIVAREMKKPCVVGTYNATKVLKDGDLVEVDADNGVVKIINHDRKIDDWVLGNEEDDVSIWSLGLWSPSLRYGLAETTGEGYPHFFVFENRHMKWFISEDRSLKFANLYLQKQIKEPTFLSTLYRQVKVLCDELYIFNNSLSSIEWSRLSNAELVNLFDKHDKLIRLVLGWGMIPAAIDIKGSILSNYAFELIKKRIDQLQLNSVTAVALMQDLLDQIDDNVQFHENLNLKKLANKINTVQVLNKINSIDDILESADISREISEHAKKYASAYYGYIGPTQTIEYIKTNLKELLKDKEVLELNIQEILSSDDKAIRVRSAAEDMLKLSKDELSLFQGLRDTVRMKTCRRDAISNSFYAMKPALIEVSNRLDIDEDLIQCMLTSEIIDLLKGIKTVTKEQLKLRKEFTVVDAETDEIKVIFGQEAKDFVSERIIDKEIGEISEFKGQIAYSGIVRGVVKIINSPEELGKIEEGEILVSVATSPQIIIAMKKASAIITEQGGITSHAAIVAREMKKPCIIGTKIATKVLKDGDMVEVDADNGIVKILNN